jgi:choline monooxygenase
MFIHDTHLPQRLAVGHYTDPDVARQEIDRLFEPAWHCVGAVAELPNPGDFLTHDILGRPVIVWNTTEGIRSYLNVCTHRFSTLTEKRQGCFAGRMKCQYHGWEYDADGNTCKIPDAQSFRPLKKGELGLRMYRTEVVGQLIFMTFNDAAADLRTWLGPTFVDLMERWFTPQHRLTLTSELDLDCNWKVVIENILESYHIACVHPKSFQDYPIPEHSTHQFFETYDHYIHDFTDEPRYANPEKWVSRFIGRAPDFQWHHLLRYPHVVLGGADPFRYLQMVWPTSPTTCRSRWITMHDSGPLGSWWAFLMHRALYRYGRYISKQVQQEDAAIYPAVHRGTAVADRPHGGGLISVREERIFAFQDYVLKHLSDP